jgi:hypothetical protein
LGIPDIEIDAQMPCSVLAVREIPRQSSVMTYAKIREIPMVGNLIPVDPFHVAACSFGCTGAAYL